MSSFDEKLKHITNTLNSASAAQSYSLNFKGDEIFTAFLNTLKAFSAIDILEQYPLLADNETRKNVINVLSHAQMISEKILIPISKKAYKKITNSAENELHIRLKKWVQKLGELSKKNAHIYIAFLMFDMEDGYKMIRRNHPEITCFDFILQMITIVRKDFIISVNKN